MAFVAGDLAKRVGDEHANSLMCGRLFCMASLVLTAQQQLRCSGCLDSTSTVLVASMVACHSMRKRKGVGERKRVYADESAYKSTLINFENRQVLVGDLQQKAC